MKSKAYLLSLPFILLSFVSCGNRKTETKVAGKPIAFLENKSVTDKLDLSRNRRYVPLDTDDEYLITEITQLICASDEIFIFDVYAQSVFVFDYSGKYLRKLDRVGQGPGEYSMMSAISLNEKEQRISIVDLGTRVVYYDIHSFEYLGERSMDAVAVEEVATEEYVAYNSLPVVKNGKGHNFHLLKYNGRDEVEKMYVPIGFESGYSMRPIHRFYKQGDDVFFYPPFTPEVYKITKDSCLVHYNVSYENLSFPPLDFLKSAESRKENYVIKLYNEHYVYSVQLFENDNFFVSLFNVGMKGYVGIYDKRMDKGFYFFRKAYLESNGDIDYLQIAGSCGADFIAVLRPSDMKGNMESADAGLREIAANLKEDSNPVLMFFQFKDMDGAWK